LTGEGWTAAAWAGIGLGFEKCAESQDQGVGEESHGEVL
jgi:hypothetical protein